MVERPQIAHLALSLILVAVLLAGAGACIMQAANQAPTSNAGILRWAPVACRDGYVRIAEGCIPGYRP